MSENPYDQPESEVAAAGGGGSLSIGEPRSRPVGHGWSWFSQGWALFAPAWGQWLLTLLLFLVVIIVIQMVPMIGWLVSQLISPVLGAGVLYMAYRAHQEGQFEIANLFAAFQQRPGPLVGLGAVNLVVTMLIFGIMFGAMAATMDVEALTEVDPENQQAAMEAMVTMFTGSGALFVLIGLALFIPWLAAMWFAVPLVYFGEYGIGAALKSSLVAVVRNILPLLWFSIIYFVLAIIATIPLGLGWLLLMPVVLLAYYSMFLDIFSQQA